MDISRIFNTNPESLARLSLAAALLAFAAVLITAFATGQTFGQRCDAMRHSSPKQSGEHNSGYNACLRSLAEVKS